MPPDRTHAEQFKLFFADSSLLDYMVLRPLARIRPNWELIWDGANSSYEIEDGSFAGQLNRFIHDLASCLVPERYHENEDILAEYVVKHLRWPIRKVGRRWIGDDYTAVVEQGGSRDVDQENLLAAAAGRIRAALVRGQPHFDDMEKLHREMLAAVMSIILYWRG